MALATAKDCAITYYFFSFNSLPKCTWRWQWRSGMYKNTFRCFYSFSQLDILSCFKEQDGSVTDKLKVTAAEPYFILETAWVAVKYLVVKFVDELLSFRCCISGLPEKLEALVILETDFWRRREHVEHQTISKQFLFDVKKISFSVMISLVFLQNVMYSKPVSAETIKHDFFFK